MSSPQAIPRSAVDPFAGYLVALPKAGRVMLLGTARVESRLVALRAAGVLDQAAELELQIYPTEHFAVILRELCLRLRLARADAFGHWIDATAAEVAAAIADYDLETGARVKSGELQLGDRGHVEGIGEVEVAGFSISRHPGLESHELVALFIAEERQTIHVPRHSLKISGGSQ
jgi:hypothetical protein